MDFIDWILGLEQYFNYWEICDEEKEQHVSNKLDREKPNGGITFKSIVGVKVSIKFAFGKE